MKIIRSKTVTDAAYEQIRSDILSGVYRPGQRLLEVKLAEELGVSRTPVRDAMIRLEQEGLIVIQPHRGMYVRKLSIKDIKDYYSVRSSLEGLSAKLATENATDKDIEKLESHLKATKEVLDSKQDNYFKKMAQNNDKFHGMIVTISKNHPLKQMMKPLANPISLVRMTSWINEERLELSWVEHREIVEAIKDGDEKEAQKRMEEHIFNVWKSARGNFEHLPTGEEED